MIIQMVGITIKIYDHHNVYNHLQLNTQIQILLNVDMYLQALNNATLIFANQNLRRYLLILTTKTLQNVQLLLEIQIKDKFIKFILKPTKLISFNIELITKSQRCCLQLNNKLQFHSKSSKSEPYKFYLDRNGYILIQCTYFLQQFLNQIHAQFILNKTLTQISLLIEQILIHIVPFIKLETLWQSFRQQSLQTEDNQQTTLTSYDKIKYMKLLNEVYKKHRCYDQSEKILSKNKNSSPVQQLLKANNLLQQDTKFVEKIQRQKNQFLQKLQEFFTFIQPKTETKKQHLNMYKMYLTQKDFEKYIKNTKKEHLDIYEVTAMHYRIVKGVQNKILLNEQKLLTDDGAHANIYFGTYTLHLSDTLFHYQFNLKQDEIQQKVVVKPLVCKRVKNMEMESSLNAFKNELSFLFHCKDKRSKFIATYFLSVEKNKDEINEIFLEYYPKSLCGYLQGKLKSSDQISLLQILKFAEGIVFALIFMVENSALHRDLKPSNVMLDGSLRPRLIDFGSCCPVFNRTQFTVKQKRILTTPEYQLKYKQTPQIIRNKYQRQEYQQHILYDVYSLGATLKQMAGYVQHLQSIGQKQKVCVNQILQMIVAKCKQPDPIDRVTYDELLYYLSILKEVAKE